MKIWIRLIALIGCVAMLMVAMASCQPKSDIERESVTETQHETDIIEPGRVISFMKSDLSKFKIVIPAKVETEVANAAYNLSQMINSICDVDIPVTGDRITTANPEYEYEILIGETNREESITFTQSIRWKDYAYGCSDTKILISGRDFERVVQAVEEFGTSVVFSKASNKAFFHSDWAKTFSPGYLMDRLNLNGRDITEYRIVYPESATTYNAELATNVQLNIADISGYILPIISDATPADGTPEILIGATNRTPADSAMTQGCGYIVGNGTTVSVYGSNAYGNTKAVKALLDCMKAQVQNDKTCMLTFGVRQEFADDRSNAIVMSYNSPSLGDSAICKERVLDHIMSILPDVFGLQEIAGFEMSAYVDWFDEYYGCTASQIGLTRGGERLPIFYAKDRYDLIDEGIFDLVVGGEEWDRYYAFAVLEDNQTKDRFVVLNTHLDFGTDLRVKEMTILLNFLKQYNDLPVIMMGDLNTHRHYNEMIMCYEAGFKDAELFLSEEDIKSIENYSQAKIDYILVTADSIIITDYVVHWDLLYGDYPSDHPAICSTIEFLDVYGEIDHGWNN